jgi:hypothetical protein
MKALLAIAALTATASAKPKPLAVTFQCTAVDDAAQRAKLDPKKRTPRPKVTHKVECALASVDARIVDTKLVGRATWPNGHADVDGHPVGDVQVHKDMRRLFMFEFDAEPWPKCDNVDLDLSIKDDKGAALWSSSVKTAGSCR